MRMLMVDGLLDGYFVFSSIERVSGQRRVMTGN